MGESSTGRQFPEIARQGVDGWVVRFSDKLTEEANRAALSLYSALEGGAVEGVDEAASALASVYLKSSNDPGKVDVDLRRLLEEEDFLSAELPQGRTLWRIPAVFGGKLGPNLEALAEDIGLSFDEAVGELTGTRLRVLALGFAPGQPYLGELPEAWNIPRLPDLIDVPEAALVVAIRQMVLFTTSSPTGWQHVGQTAFRTYRPDAEKPFALSPGDEIVFSSVSTEELENIRESDNSGNGGAVREQLK